MTHDTRVVLKYQDRVGHFLGDAAINLADKADQLFDSIHSDGLQYGTSGTDTRWNWVRDKLASWCLRKADFERADVADVWIERYRAIRGIK